MELGLPFTHKPQQDNMHIYHPSMNIRHTYTEKPYNPAIVVGAPGADHFFDPGSPLLWQLTVLRYRTVLVASIFFFSVGMQGPYFNVRE